MYLWSGKVVFERNDVDARVIHRYNEMFHRDPRVEVLMLADQGWLERREEGLGAVSFELSAISRQLSALSYQLPASSVFRLSSRASLITHLLYYSRLTSHACLTTHVHAQSLGIKS